MAAKITVFIITLLLNVIAGAVILLFMIVAMNGFSESDATWGLGAYILLAFVVATLMSTGALLLVNFLAKKLYRPVVSALIAIPAFSIIGVGLEMVCSLIGVGVAEIVRVKF